jgi:hypothetical protein
MRRTILMATLLALVLSLCVSIPSFAADIRAVPSGARVSPGDSFYVDIIAGNIPDEGLGAVQFRLDVVAEGSPVSGVADTSLGRPADVSVATPLIIGPPSASRSGLGDFFRNAAGPNGILVMDNESLVNGSALFTYAHTNGSTPPGGSGSVARFMFVVGREVTARKITITLSDVMLLDSGTDYTIESNTGATIEVGCRAVVPNLIGLSLSEAQAALHGVGLIPGNVYEIDNPNGSLALNKVLEQTPATGTAVICDSSVNLAVNTATSDVTQAAAADKTGDETGTVTLSWTHSSSSDAAGYRIYLISGSQSLLKEITNPAATGTEIMGLNNAQASQIRITAFDTFGNESTGAIISAMPVDDVAPRITVSGVTEGAYYASDVLPVITVLDTNLSNREITVDGVPYGSPAISAEGNHTLKITATDGSGNSTTREIHFVIDKNPPVISVSGIEKGRHYNTDLVPVISAADVNLQKVESFLNGSLYESGSLISPEGNYELRIVATDKAGNASSDLYTFSIDKTKPLSSMTIGLPRFDGSGSIFVSASTLFTLAGNDEGVVVSGINRLEYRLGNSEWSTYQSPFALAGIGDGAIAVDYRAVDLAGNIEGYHTQTVQADNTPPAVEITVSDPKYQTTVNLFIGADTEITVSAADSGNGVKIIEYSIDGGMFAPFTQPVTMAEYAEGLHTICYRSSDNIGNIGETKSLAVVLDKTPPQTTISATGSFAEGTVNIVSPKTLFTLDATDVLSGVKEILYSIDGGAWMTYATSFSISGMTAGEHTISFKAADNVLNEETAKTVIVKLIVIEVTKEVASDPVLLAGAWWQPENNGKNDNKDKQNTQSAVNNIAMILSASGIKYHIPENEDDFKESLRSGRYNTYILADFRDEEIVDELREAVYYGYGLIFIKTRPNADPALDDLFGVKFTGKTTTAGLPVLIPESQISGEYILQNSGKAIDTTLIAETAEALGYVTDKNKTYPVIVSNDYGRGKVILYTFDLLNNIDQAKVTGLLGNSISYVKPAEHYLMPFDSALVRIIYRTAANLLI